MRSRYSAYVVGAIAYLQATTLPAQQQALDLQSMKEWSANSTWLGLDVEQSQVLGGQPEHALVSFTARWHDGAKSTLNMSAQRSCSTMDAGTSSIPLSR